MATSGEAFYAVVSASLAIIEGTSGSEMLCLVELKSTTCTSHLGKNIQCPKDVQRSCYDMYGPRQSTALHQLQAMHIDRAQ